MYLSLSLIKTKTYHCFIFYEIRLKFDINTAKDIEKYTFNNEYNMLI